MTMLHGTTKSESDATSVPVTTKKLNHTLTAALHQEKLCQQQVDKWNTKLEELEKTRRDTEAFLAAAVKLKADASSKVAEAAKRLNDTVAHDLPAQAESSVQDAATRNDLLQNMYSDLYAKQLEVFNATLHRVLQGCSSLTEEARAQAVQQATMETTLNDAAKAQFQANIQAVLSSTAQSSTAGKKRPADTDVTILSSEQIAEADAARAEAARIRNAAEQTAKDAVIP